MEGQRGDRHGPARLLPPRPAVLDLPSPQKKVAFTQPDASPVRGNIAPESPFGLLAATCPCQLRPMPMSPPPDAYLTSATCPSQLRAMPISPPPDAYVTAARCLCRPGHMPMSLWRHAYVTLARCLCRQSDIGISPAPHQKRPVYRCSGRPFFVLFGHFRHEMRIFLASEGVFRGGRRVAVADNTFVETVSVRQNLSDLWKICPDTHPRSQPTWLPSPLRQDKNPIMGEGRNNFPKISQTSTNKKSSLTRLECQAGFAYHRAGLTTSFPSRLPRYCAHQAKVELEMMK